MSFFERCRNFTVKVNGGSGVIFQPMTEDYTYVLTAKHNLYEDPETMKIPIEKNEIQAIDIIINFIDKYEHNELDIAILKIKKIDVETPLKEFIEASEDNTYNLYGYPGYKREGSENIEEEIENFRVNFPKKSNNKITFDDPAFTGAKGIKGVSGGGVFREDGESIYLVAIEYEMNDSRATHQRIDMVSIEAFDEIIEQKQSELEPLYPPFMNDFDLLVDDIFLLNDFEDKRDLIRNKLKYLVRQAIRQIKPLDIKEEFKNELFVKGHDVNNISNNKLWSMYLEFILLAILLDNEEDINIDKIKEIYKKRKILFAKTNRWIELKEDILKSNLYGLEKNGIVLIACDGDRRPHKCELNTKTILNIANPPQIEEMQINSGIDYTKDFKYKHIFSVEKHMLDNESAFDNSTNINIKDKIKEVLQNVFE